LWKVISDFVVPFFIVCMDMFLIFFFLGTSLETRVGDSDKKTTNAINTNVETTQLELEAPATSVEGCKLLGRLLLSLSRRLLPALLT